MVDCSESVGSVPMSVVVCAEKSDSRAWTRVNDVEKWSPMLA